MLPTPCILCCITLFTQGKGLQYSDGGWGDYVYVDESANLEPEERERHADKNRVWTKWIMEWRASLEDKKAEEEKKEEELFLKYMSDLKVSTLKPGM